MLLLSPFQAQRWKNSDSPVCLCTIRCNNSKMSLSQTGCIKRGQLTKVFSCPAIVWKTTHTDQGCSIRDGNRPVTDVFNKKQASLSGCSVNRYTSCSSVVFLNRKSSSTCVCYLPNSETCGLKPLAVTTNKHMHLQITQMKFFKSNCSIKLD